MDDQEDARPADQLADDLLDGGAEIAEFLRELAKGQRERSLPPRQKRALAGGRPPRSKADRLAQPNPPRRKGSHLRLISRQPSRVAPTVPQVVSSKDSRELRAVRPTVPWREMVGRPQTDRRSIC